MKILKYIGIAILIILGVAVGPSIAMVFGTCTFLGFLIIGGLDSLGIIEIPPGENFNVVAGISFVIGLIISLIYFGITGWPEV